MDTSPTADRPYRSHLQPACIPCRRRKSRCQTEANTSMCLMCKLHNSHCTFPESFRADSQKKSDHGRGKRRQSRKATSETSASQLRETGTRTLRQRNRARASNAIQSQLSDSVRYREFSVSGEPTALHSADDENLNLHIVGPAATDDSRVLTDYLAGVPGAPRGTRMVIPTSSGKSNPVLFNTIQKRPLGIALHRSPSAERLAIIEKLLEPCLDEIIHDYFSRINDCMPLLDEDSFRHQFQADKGKISPALLACLYAHMVVHCKNTFRAAHKSWPDGRFVWNLANEALYSDLHLSPGVSIITAILLNVGGRPTTSLIGNGVLLSSAVSIAHSLGLNHNPLDWNIPKQEKYLRIKIWWALFVQDKWTSLAHGTPARITQRQQNVPLPTIQHLCRPDSTQSQLQVASIFTALVGLTAVLDLSLGQIYDIEEHESNVAQIESALQEWIESLVGTSQQIIMHATKLDVPGACNLRLAYLSMKLLMQRIQLEAARQDPGSSAEYKLNVFLKGRQVAEEILIFTQNLRPSQLNDFWLSVGAFVYPTTLNFLLRHALETEHSPMGLAQTSSFQLARQFVDVLRVHKEKHSWDMGDVCLAQHAEIVEKVLANLAPENHGADNIFDLQDFAIPDASILDGFFPSLWDPLQNVW